MHICRSSIIQFFPLGLIFKCMLHCFCLCRGFHYPGGFLGKWLQSKCSEGSEVKGRDLSRDCQFPSIICLISFSSRVVENHFLGKLTIDFNDLTTALCVTKNVSTLPFHLPWETTRKMPTAPLELIFALSTLTSPLQCC